MNYETFALKITKTLPNLVKTIFYISGIENTTYCTMYSVQCTVYSVQCTMYTHACSISELKKCKIGFYYDDGSIDMYTLT